MSESQRFFGKYRGTVVDNVDFMQMGRIQAIVPDVSALAPTSWCMPCLPVAGLQTGVFTVPPVGAGVWIEFEQGDPDYPIWSGCYWGSPGEVPPMARLVPPELFGITLQTTGQNGVVISDAPGPTGGIMLRSTSGASIIVNDTGIYIQNGQGASIVMTGPTVTVNGDALQVT
jgi:uncharacterized protein involved in type VI secretion and phage assembly